MKKFINKKRAEMEVLNLGYIHERNSVVCPYCYEGMEFNGCNFHDGAEDIINESYQCEHCKKDFIVYGDIQHIFNSYSRRIEDKPI